MNENKECQNAFDKASIAVFMSQQYSAFLATILCSLKLEFVGSESKITTAATDGKSLIFNRDFFLNLEPEARKTLLLHEIWHVAKLHSLRMQNRDPEIWNIACDYHINAILEDQGYSFKGLEAGCIDSRRFGNMAEEDIYDVLMQNPPPKNQMPDLLPNGEGSPSDAEQVELVLKAIQQSAISNKTTMNNLAGTVPGDIQTLIDEYLKPVVKWNTILNRFMHDTFTIEETNWSKRNRRFQNIYLPSSTIDEDKLSHLIYYIDISGSVTDEQVKRFASEVNYVHAEFKPKRITVVSFDTEIHDVIEINEYDKFPNLNFTGRGGTSLAPVREHILAHKPTAAIIFSDLYCPYMEEIEQQSVLWLVIDNPNAEVKFGEIVHIKE